jgi:hypothetical protein
LDNDDDDNDDVGPHHPAGPLFWVHTLKSNIATPSSSDPLNMSTVQRNFVSKHGGGVGGIVGGGGGRVRGEGNVGEEEAEEDNDGFLSMGGGKR